MFLNVFLNILYSVSVLVNDCPMMIFNNPKIWQHATIAVTPHPCIWGLSGLDWARFGWFVVWSTPAPCDSQSPKTRVCLRNSLPMVKCRSAKEQARCASIFLALAYMMLTNILKAKAGRMAKLEIEVGNFPLASWGPGRVWVCNTADGGCYSVHHNDAITSVTWFHFGACSCAVFVLTGRSYSTVMSVVCFSMTLFMDILVLLMQTMLFWTCFEVSPGAGVWELLIITLLYRKMTKTLTLIREMTTRPLNGILRTSSSSPLEILQLCQGCKFIDLLTIHR